MTSQTIPHDVLAAFVQAPSFDAIGRLLERHFPLLLAAAIAANPAARRPPKASALEGVCRLTDLFGLGPALRFDRQIPLVLAAPRGLSPNPDLDPARPQTQPGWKGLLQMEYTLPADLPDVLERDLLAPAGIRLGSGQRNTAPIAERRGPARLRRTGRWNLILFAADFPLLPLPPGAASSAHEALAMRQPGWQPVS